jgi:hypothetical protein
LVNKLEEWTDKYGSSEIGVYEMDLAGKPRQWNSSSSKQLTICGGAVKGHLATLTSKEEDAFVFDQVAVLAGYTGLPFKQGP